MEVTCGSTYPTSIQRARDRLRVLYWYHSLHSSTGCTRWHTLPTISQQPQRVILLQCIHPTSPRLRIYHHSIRQQCCLIKNATILLPKVLSTLATIFGDYCLVAGNRDILPPNSATVGQNGDFGDSRRFRRRDSLRIRRLQSPKRRKRNAPKQPTESIYRTYINHHQGQKLFSHWPIM